MTPRGEDLPPRSVTAAFFAHGYLLYHVSLQKSIPFEKYFERILHNAAFFCSVGAFLRLALDRRRSGAKVVHESAAKGLNFCESCGIMKRYRMGRSCNRAAKSKCRRMLTIGD